MSEVLSLRIRRDLKEAMKKIAINWYKEIEKFIEAKIKEYTKGLYLKKAKKEGKN